jgi:hypothetical protein
MTLTELRTEVWQDLGEPPDIDPAEAAGLAKLNSWINRAYKKILFWKFPDGTQLRFPSTEGEAFFKTVVVTGTVSSATTSVVVLDASAGANVDQYNGWVLEIGGICKLIVDYDASRNATVHEAYSTVPSGTYKLYKRFMRFCALGAVGASENILLRPVGEVAEIRKVTDLATGTDLVPAERTDAFSQSLLNPSSPTSYFKRQDEIVFDYPVDEVLWFRLEYVRIPPDLVLDADKPEMPEFFHDAIELWAVWRGQRFMQDFSAAYSTKRDLQDLLTSTKQQAEMSYDRESGQAEVG